MKYARYLPLTLNGMLVGHMAGLAYGTGTESWLAVLGSAVLVTAYGVLLQIED